MAKIVTAQVKVQIVAGQATPAPPIGTSLGPHGINLGKFVSEFNERTRDITGTVVPVIVTVYKDRSFEFIVKTPPAAVLIKQAAKVAKGAANPKQTIGSITSTQLKEIADRKIIDMNCSDLDAAIRTLRGTARSLGVSIIDN